jgi:chromosome segregation ATPase
MVLDTGAGVAPLTVGAAPYPDPYIKPALGLGASGMAFSLDDARDRIERRDATIAEQSAEIERLKHDIDALKFDTGTLTTERDTLRASRDYLKGERDMLRSALEIAGRRSDSQNASIAYFEQESASHDSALAEVTTERDTLRLEVQKLKDLNFEAQDRYAALEAERDEARRASETVHSHYVLALKQRDEAVANTRAECDKGYEALFQAHQRMVAERDELKRERAERMSALEAAMRTIAAQNAQVRAMNEQLDAVTRLIVQRMENSTHE